MTTVLEIEHTGVGSPFTHPVESLVFAPNSEIHVFFMEILQATIYA